MSSIVKTIKSKPVTVHIPQDVYDLGMKVLEKNLQWKKIQSYILYALVKDLAEKGLCPRPV